MSEGSGATGVEIDAANKANDQLGDIKDRKPGFWGFFQKKVHRLSSDRGTDILNTYEAAELSDVDLMTGVGSARAQEKFLAMNDRMLNEAAMSSDRRNEIPVFPEFGLLLYLDADGLKAANYTDREKGDKLLIMIAEAAKTVARRPHDKVFRQGAGGGDEYAVFLPGDSVAHMEEVVRRFENALKEVSQGKVTASLIVGEYGGNLSAREALKTFDKKLASAKAARAERGSHVETIYIK